MQIIYVTMSNNALIYARYSYCYPKVVPKLSTPLLCYTTAVIILTASFICKE